MPKQLKWVTNDGLKVECTPVVEREEFLDYMTFQGNGSILFVELMGPLIGLKEEWEEQGATEAELSFAAFRYRAPKIANVPANTNRLGTSETVIEDSETELVTLDDLGRRMRLKKGVASRPLPDNFPVKTMDDWMQIKPKFAFHESRFRKNWRQRAEQARDDGYALRVAIPGGFDLPRQLLGEEELCYAFYDQPELIHDILHTVGDTAYRVLDRVSGEVQVDILYVHEDMAGKSGSLAGPDQIREFILPYYRKVWDMLYERGARLFDQDSDGDMRAVIPAFLEAGVNMMHPLECASNMDIVTLRQEYGSRLAFCGGLDKHVLRRSKEEILAELEYKLPPMMQTGGCMLALDHRIPNGTPLENYRFYVEQVWKIIG